MHESRLKKCVQNESLQGIDNEKMTELSFCEGCLAGKMCREPFPTVGEIGSTRKLQLVHSNVCGPMQTQSIGGAKYIVTFIDDYTRCGAVYFMKHKSEVLDKFKEFEAKTTNAAGRAIGTLLTDNGGEYLSSAFQNYLKEKGIRHELTMPHAPQQNGVSERMNRTLVGSARSMIAHAGLSNIFLAEAISVASYVRNRLPTTDLKEREIPYERWYGRKPDVSHFRVFGCMAYAHVPDCERRKLETKSKRMRFVGYGLTSKGYRLFDETNRKLCIRRDVEFNESDFGQKTAMTTEPDIKSIEVNQNADATAKDEEVAEIRRSEKEEERQEPQVHVEQELRRSERTRKTPVRYGYDEYADTATYRLRHVAYHLSEIDEPSTIQEAESSYHAAKWKVATDAEYNSLIENYVGVCIVQDKERKEVYLHQGQYLEKMLKKFGQTEAKTVSTPADFNVKLQKEDSVSSPVDAISYQSIVGSLLYAAITTRPDIAQAVGVVSKFCGNSTQSHLTAAKRIFRYLKGTVYLGLSYKKCADGNLIGYSDADWAGDVDDRHSTSGNMFLLAKGAVSWLNKKQATVALSTAEPEYVALSAATQEAIWLRRLLTDVGEPLEDPIVINEDNQGAIAMAKNPMGHVT